MSNESKTHISRRDFLRIGATGAATAALGTLGLSQSLFAANQNSKPNIIVILSDDHGYAEIGCQGLKDVPTPNIDSIAKNGVRFTDGYVTCPVCSPTRAGLITGRYQQRFGHEFNPGLQKEVEYDVGLDVTEVTLAQRLKSAGYATGVIGKWHLGHKREFLPLQRGFDEFYGFPGGAHPYFPDDKRDLNPIMRGNDEVEEKEYLTDAFSREAVDFIKRHSKEPFFLYLPFNAVHSPMQASDKYLGRFPNIKDKKRKAYAGILAALDDAVGSILTELRKNNLEENTQIFFLADNGMPKNYDYPGNAPLRGYKTDVYEGGIRIPFLAQWKGKIPAGMVYDKPVISLDIFATSIAAAGVTPPINKNLDGVDLLPFLIGKNNANPHYTLYWRFGYRKAIRHGNMKLVMMGEEAPELYDLSNDIGETKNLASEKPETVKEISQLFEKWNAELVKPSWGRLTAMPSE